MLYIACGIILFMIGLIWLISPAKKPNNLYGYVSYLAIVSEEGFKFAQKSAAKYFMLYGSIQFGLGLIIHLLKWDGCIVLWLLTFYLFIIFPFISTEKALQRFLKARDLLPYDYIEPDKVKHKLTKGFKD